MVVLCFYGNEIILMIKGLVIVLIVMIYDLMGEIWCVYLWLYDF